MKKTFDIIVLNARPAAGKSEIIDYLKRTPLAEREKRFHVGEFEEIDDFPMLWTWFEEDDILQKMGYDRLHSDKDGYFLGEHLWHVLIERMALEYNKRATREENYHETYTTILEFSRGSEHGGYEKAYEHLPKDILRRMAILYLDVTFEESLRKNRARFNPDRPDSILEHGLPDEKMYKLYHDVDWDKIPKLYDAYVEIKGVRVPYVVFDNADDVTTQRGEALGERLETLMQTLWKRRHSAG
ncbi:MAG: hypothetical protein JEZ00_13740 [Anaerolineaceae bacterium]|nr:hypothetical protein [Anaerolineaceae bacterium]